MIEPERRDAVREGGEHVRVGAGADGGEGEGVDDEDHAVAEGEEGGVGDAVGVLPAVRRTSHPGNKNPCGNRRGG